jgi:hypothetical protein
MWSTDSDDYEDTDTLGQDTVYITIEVLTFWRQEGLAKRRYLWVCTSSHGVMFQKSGIFIAIAVDVKR